MFDMLVVVGMWYAALLCDGAGFGVRRASESVGGLSEANLIVTIAFVLSTRVVGELGPARRHTATRRRLGTTVSTPKTTRWLLPRVFGVRVGCPSRLPESVLGRRGRTSRLPKKALGACTRTSHHPREGPNGPILQRSSCALDGSLDAVSGY